MSDRSSDEREIRDLVAAQFAALAWNEDGEADWPSLNAGFFPGAHVIPAVRPARLQPVATFVDRMQQLKRDGKLKLFSEKLLGLIVHRFGSVAVALAGCEITENGDTITRDVSAFLLVRSDGRWSIAAQAWDVETGSLPLPDELRRAAVWT